MASRLRCHPPELTKDDERYPGHDPRYAKLTDAELPTTESLALTIDRVVPYWNETILPRLKSGERVIIAAHGNSLRALVKYLDNMGEDEILELNIPTGVPLVYEFDENFADQTLLSGQRGRDRGESGCRRQPGKAK